MNTELAEDNMTTSQSPKAKIEKQATHIAHILKSSEAANFGHTGSVNFAIVMDDKVVKVEMPWQQIKASSHDEIKEFIVKQMAEETEQ